MSTIHKFELKITDRQVIEIPGFVRVISVLNQRERLVVYAEVKPQERERKGKVEFAVIGTGNPMLDGANWRFVGSVSMSNGDLIWHVFQTSVE